jgi:hypothetical protein
VLWTCLPPRTLSYCKRAGISRCPSSGALTIELKGAHPKIVSEMLRHSSIAITLDAYSTVMPGLGEAEASAMEDALGE